MRLPSLISSHRLYHFINCLLSTAARALALGIEQLCVTGTFRPWKGKNKEALESSCCMSIDVYDFGSLSGFYTELRRSFRDSKHVRFLTLNIEIMNRGTVVVLRPNIYFNSLI